MNQRVLFITPPFVQLNTPYPATPYLKGFLNTKGIESYQVDLGIETILDIFSSHGFELLFDTVEASETELSDNAYRMVRLKDEYLSTIDEVIRFLQNKNSTLAHAICSGQYLPEASRFEQMEDLEWAFGSLGTHDKARHLATLYLEDISDLIIEVIDPHFGFSRYAEKLGLSASSFSPIHDELQMENTYVDEVMLGLLEKKFQEFKPTLVSITIPFPGSLYSTLKCGQWIKQHYPNIPINIGGGYVNTELRSLEDVRVFEYADFITLDDGEAPIYHLLEHLEGTRTVDHLKRTFVLDNDTVVYCNGSDEKDYSQKEVGTPDYNDLNLDNYLSVIEIANPMHRLWSDGRWNKLTLAHGCYWGKCSFCDVSLDYIKIYEPSKAQLLCDRIETLIEQTGNNGFHFVDEAAPPSLLRELALEILRRKLTVVWWTNIRFEKNFSRDLCQLLKASGCIAVSGGLEVASDRLLKLIDKGVTVSQVANVTANFTEAGIMVHAYLMYGFPTQTAQETIDSLEMVRQLFELGIVHSAYWHRFSMTAHSPIGLNPSAYGVSETGPDFDGFAHNDLFHNDPKGGNHDLFGEGLRKSLFNYMHGLCFDYHLQEWFNDPVPTTIIGPTYIEDCLQEPDGELKMKSRIIWLGNTPDIQFFEEKRKGKTRKMAQLVFYMKGSDFVLNTSEELGHFLADMIPQIMVWSSKTTLEAFCELLESKTNTRAHEFINGPIWNELKDNGLLLL